MPREPSKEPTKQPPSRTGLDTEIDSEGYSVFVSFSDRKTGDRVMLTLHRRAAAALTALLGAVDASEDSGATEVTLRGDMQITRSTHAEPSAISAA
jgi:hypothetical protein